MPDFYSAVGGLEGCRRLSAAFYARVAIDPVLIPVFPGSSHCAVEALARFLAQFLGGPCVYSPQRWYLSLREAHRPFKIGQAERDAWMRNMRETMAEAGIANDARAALDEVFDQFATYLVTPEPAPIKGALASHYARLLTVEEAVAWVRGGRVPELERLEDCFQRDPMARIALLGLMIGAAMDGPVRRQLEDHPELAKASYARNRTLFHDAAIAGNVPMVKHLLALGADPNGAGGHPPLYEVGNAGMAATAGDVVRVLVKAGADVNLQEGAKRCTALHMAARRGNVAVSEALLDCGAALELRDSQGETPLRRAVNCGKVEVAALLLARGADRHSVGSKGVTAVQAARTAAMKRAFGVG